MRVAILGRGRVALHLQDALLQAGHSIQMCGGRDGLEPVDNADVVIVSVSDDAVKTVVDRIELRNCEPLVVHTAGSVAMDVLSYWRRGVMYPLQTFSMNRKVDMSKVPFFIEACREDDLCVLECLVRSISDNVMKLDSEHRKVLHLAAVLCCNFPNHLFDLTAGMLEKSGIPFSMMLPLINETVAKLSEMHPHDAQTGPASRGDVAVMNAHMNMIDNQNLRRLYDMMSKSIANYD